MGARGVVAVAVRARRIDTSHVAHHLDGQLDELAEFGDVAARERLVAEQERELSAHSTSERRHRAHAKGTAKRTENGLS